MVSVIDNTYIINRISMSYVYLKMVRKIKTNTLKYNMKVSSPRRFRIER